MKIKIKDKNLYYVGGVVRDEMLGISSIDTDYCYEGNAIDFSKDLNVINFNGNRYIIDIFKKTFNACNKCCVNGGHGCFGHS